MGKNLKGKEIGRGICQRKDGLYCASFVTKLTLKDFVCTLSAIHMLQELLSAVCNSRYCRGCLVTQAFRQQWTAMSMYQRIHFLMQYANSK